MSRSPETQKRIDDLWDEIHVDMASIAALEQAFPEEDNPFGEEKEQPQRWVCPIHGDLGGVNHCPRC